MIELLAFLVALVPFLELRVAIPFAIASGNNPEIALVGCILLNLLAIPIAYLLIETILPPIRRRVKLVERMFGWAVKRARKHQNLGLVGLALFVGIPLPVTGAYTGYLISYVAGMDRKLSALAIAVGVVIAGVLMWAFAYLGIIVISGITPG